MTKPFKSWERIEQSKTWLDTNLQSLNTDKLCSQLLQRTLLYPVIKMLLRCTKIIAYHKHIYMHTIHRADNLTGQAIHTSKSKVEKHINAITNKIWKIIYMLKQLKPLISVRILKLVYNSVVESMLNYLESNLYFCPRNGLRKTK